MILSFIFSCADEDKIEELATKNESITAKGSSSAIGRVRTASYQGLPNYLVSLTYDDGPGPGTLALAKYLYNEKISATFFINSNNTGFPTAPSGHNIYPILDSLFKYGHRIGNHTYGHTLQLNNTSLSCSAILNEITPTQTAINSVIKNNLVYMRPPWGYWCAETSACLLGNSTLDMLRGPILWDYDTKDYENRYNTNPTQFAQTWIGETNNAQNFNNHVGGIILMHDANNYSVQNFALEETQVIVTELKSKGYIFTSPTLEFSPVIQNMSQGNDFSDATGWASDVGYFGTIRLGDVNGDGQADVIARATDGIMVALALPNGQGFGAASYWTTDFSDSQGWNPAQYSITIQCGDVDGDKKSDIIGRFNDGVWVARSNGSGFYPMTKWTDQFSDDPTQDWDSDIGYYGTIRVADVTGDNKADLVGRGASGVYVAKSNGSRFCSATLWTSQFSDMQGQEFKPAKYSTTIQCADVDGDGDADLVARGASGIYVALSSTSGFSTATLWTSSFSDNSG